MSNYNVRIKVMDGGVWWDNIKQRRGWKLQQNKLTGHYRIISPDKYREAWGYRSDGDELSELFDEMTGDYSSSGRDSSSSSSSTRVPETPSPTATPPHKPSKSEVLAQLKELGELYEAAVLTKEEFEAAKQKLLKEL
jgi:hypothetical protein